MTRKKVPAPPQFTAKFGYSQATRAGNFIAVSGTAPRGEGGGVVCQGDVYGQARQVLLNIQNSLEALGASMRNVVRSRVYITDMEHLWDIGRAHLEFFADIEPAVSLVEVERFFDPEVMVEMEVDAVVD
jgi:enamine deaminase RidA (YjgF/YER057c/UK114 family)